jgi:hypothetical protein
MPCVELISTPQGAKSRFARQSLAQSILDQTGVESVFYPSLRSDIAPVWDNQKAPPMPSVTNLSYNEQASPEGEMYFDPNDGVGNAPVQ